LGRIATSRDHGRGPRNWLRQLRFPDGIRRLAKSHPQCSFSAPAHPFAGAAAAGTGARARPATIHERISPTNDNWSSRFTALAPVQFESLWESGVTTSLRGGAGTAHRSGVASAWGKSLGRTPGGAWRELGEELEKSPGRNVAKARGGARSKAGSDDSRRSGKKSSSRLAGAPDWKPREGRGDETPRGTRRELGEKSLSGPSSCEKNSLERFKEERKKPWENSLEEMVARRRFSGARGLALRCRALISILGGMSFGGDELWIACPA
jgi:hypothetical protein